MARFGLPDIDFVNRDPSEIEAEMVAKFEEKTGIVLAEADPRRKFLQAIAYAFSLGYNRIDYTAKQNSLAYAEDDYLDHIGSRKGVPRLGPKAAECIMRYELKPIRNMVIPKGHRVAYGNEVFFATVEETVVPEGAQYVDVKVQCTEAGPVGNGFLIGQITNIVDPIPFVSKVYNITETSGGTDWEDDDSYAERIQQSPERYSTAGPEGAYIFYAQMADQRIVDVSVDSPSDGVVEIVVLLQNGELPDQTVLDRVLEICNDKTIRPLTDRVIVRAPEVVSYDISMTYYVPRSKAGVLADIQKQVQKAADEYIVWQKSKLGRWVDPSELIARVKAAGASRCFVQSPASFIEVSKAQVAKESNVSLTFGGLVDD
ncbi:baseplate J/gp47 family protein [Geobacillus subterraneus]|uniref:baseplate assembly protein n=1 Tax=Geobacillus subterraneus TaxID=129338 RepID=UPI002AC89B3F|nr:baseplate J/gp47 family protein [Geobacillus subterraneus]WPZ18924.1 baseplate J/gp47 family protein [Geobacillus subterraneus]